MSEKRSMRCCHTEHELWRCGVGPTNAEDTRLFRAPNVLDGSDACWGSLQEISWTDAEPGDVIFALYLNERIGFPSTIPLLQFWHVLEVQDDTWLVEVNCIAGSGSDGQYVYDRMVGLLGCRRAHVANESDSNQ